MELFEVSPFQNNNPSYLSAIRKEIDMDPIYQRQSGVWAMPKRQLLIDSILNGFDLPKIYLHKYSEPVRKDGVRTQYAMVDGKQRLNSILDFMDNKFALADDFVLLREPSAKLHGLTFNELSESYPEVIALFVSTAMPIFIIKTSDIEYIEEMFSRMNDGVPLNAPEKRNAFGGPAPKAVQDIAAVDFFTAKLPFSDTRYRHRDLAAKFFLWEDDWSSGDTGAVKDVKKRQLDDLFRNLRTAKEQGIVRANIARDRAIDRLEAMSTIFIDDDPLLQSVGMVSVYYILMQDRQLNSDKFPTRDHLKIFEERRRKDIAVEDDKLTRGHVALLEFNRLAQSPNDNSALVYRFNLIDVYTKALAKKEDPLKAIGQFAPEQKPKDI